MSVVYNMLQLSYLIYCGSCEMWDNDNLKFDGYDENMNALCVL